MQDLLPWGAAPMCAVRMHMFAACIECFAGAAGPGHARDFKFLLSASRIQPPVWKCPLSRAMLQGLCNLFWIWAVG